MYLEVGLIHSLFSKRNKLNWTIHPQLQNFYQSGLLYLRVNSSLLITAEEILYFIDQKIYQRKRINQIFKIPFRNEVL